MRDIEGEIYREDQRNEGYKRVRSHRLNEGYRGGNIQGGSEE